MNKSIIGYSVIFILLLLASCVSTEFVPGSNKMDNVIIISTSDSPSSAFKNLTQMLSFEGFSIENIDKELFILSTGPKNTSKLNASLKINILIREEGSTKIYLSGLVSSDASAYYGGVTYSTGWDRIVNRGMSGSIMQVGWNDLYNFAKKYPNGEISFDRN